ncbi:LacI family DNA-binding transcriptional regulator [Bifidobacterium simiarum]|uniref:HTH lacI-type domain-containing protein n=1 Tax=Bifidobacterium simiarum TaxID=2045441 RepID=A0A2M9HEV9_9BIFI|nr:LacI family DNA-binding transcriptional regulator [Bifidobacterium simiarum]PJM75335.1 hypothetical protein CSQ87_04790 [Bifidobacterium simiarum]
MAFGKKVKSQDVADLAGVSRTTVSLVMNGRDDSIPEKTRHKVLDAANELGFVPSAVARQLRRGRSRIVLCLAPGWMPSGRADELWGGLSRQLDEKGFTCVFSRSAGSTTSLRQLLSELNPGVVAPFFPLQSNDLRLLDRLNIPVAEVYMSRSGNDLDTPWRRFQHDVGVTQAAYLLESGVTRIAYLGTSDHLGADISADRLLGARETVEAAGLSLTACESVDLSEVALKAAIERMRDLDVEAVCAFNDDYAAALLGAAKSAGIEVPRQMRVIGVDDLYLGRYLSPSLTSVNYRNNFADIYTPQIVAAYEGRTAEVDPDLGLDLWVVRRESA